LSAQQEQKVNFRLGKTLMTILDLGETQPC